MAIVTYQVATSDLSKSIDQVAEDIIDLANSIRNKYGDMDRITHEATAIMYLAADLRAYAEARKKAMQS